MIELIEKIKSILENTDEKNWVMVFQKLIEESYSVDDDVLKRKIRNIYGGVGSFNDLVLYKNGQPCIEENQKLDDLRKELFREIILTV